MPAIAAARPALTADTVPRRRLHFAASATVPNLHQLDGRDPTGANQAGIRTYRTPYSKTEFRPHLGPPEIRRTTVPRSALQAVEQIKTRNTVGEWGAPTDSAIFDLANG